MNSITVGKIVICTAHFILYINKYDISDAKLNEHYDKDFPPPTFNYIKRKMKGERTELFVMPILFESILKFRGP